MATGGLNETSSNLLKARTLTLKPGDLHPWGVVVVGNKLVITDFKSDKVRVYSIDGKLLSSTDRLESTPFGLCRVSDTELCVAMKDGIIAIMSVQDSGLISSDKTFDLRSTFDLCHYVALWKDNIVVSGEKDNTLCWCDLSLKDGRPDKLHKVCRVFWTSYLTVKQDMVYITCTANSDDSGVYGFNLLNPSKPTYTYKHKELRRPCGITVDDIGHLFVCNVYDMYSSIHHLTGNCELVTIYKNDLLLQPLAIFWDRGVLYLTSYESNVITMYKTPQQGPAIPAKTKNEVDREDQKEKIQLDSGETRASKQDKVSQIGNISTVKQEAKISHLISVINVDPVEQVTQRLSETGIHGSLLTQLSKDLICDDWRFFFRDLPVREEDITRIALDYRNYTVREQIYQLLYFSNKKGILNKTNMMKALKSIDRVDLVTKYTQETFPDS